MSKSAATMDRMKAAARLLPLIDLTDLGENSSAHAVAALSAQAITPRGITAAICIWPRFVETAKPLLHGTGVRIATVVNFPHGGTDLDAVMMETDKALADGADEVDLVLPYRDFRNNGAALSRQMIKSARTRCGRNAKLKVIIESGELAAPGLTATASEVALEEGADFIKTSTGKAKVHATLAAARIMLETIQDHSKGAGFKASGGIRTVEQAIAYLDLADGIMGDDWVTPQTFRFGATRLLEDVLAALDGKTFVNGKGS